MTRLSALGVLAVLTLWAASAYGADEAIERNLGNPNSVNACIGCHDQPAVTSVLHGVHMTRADARTGVAAQGCQSCHGQSDDHVARVPEGAKRPQPEITFTGANITPLAKRNDVCAGCHNGGSTTHWLGSLHETSDVACTSCHVSHPMRDPVLVKTSQAKVCFDCHANQRAAAVRPSHHPVTEGQMACSDCHNPHGAVTANMLKGATVNDTCLSCHDEKRGPFLWEHPPAQEQCTLCHTPHGSVQASLLRQRPPFLCQNCHESSQHNSQPFSGASLPGGALPSRQAVLRGCLNCHGQIHGSNHPSGARFSR